MSTTANDELKAPFPYFGGKATIADLVWQRLGDVANYIEPFAGSCAVLLRRPAEHVGATETISDANHFLANFWRAVKYAPGAVAVFADWPVNEVDCHARHAWLMRSEQSAEIRQRINDDPDYYDARTAGWWCWGQSLWIASGWCVGSQSRQLPHISDAAGKGVHRQRPHISHAAGKGECEQRAEWLREWMTALSDRLRNVRVCCGDWARVCSSPSTMVRTGTPAGVFLDPPYLVTKDDGTASRSGDLYQGDDASGLTKLRDDVLAWCRKWGQSRDARICLAEYEGHGYESLESEGWAVVPWATRGGYGNAAGGKNDNTGRERLWFSPGCIQPVAERLLF